MTTRKYNAVKRLCTISSFSLTFNAVFNAAVEHFGESLDKMTAAQIAAFGWEFVTNTLMNGAKDHGVKIIEEALKAAARLVRKYDHMKPTTADIEAVKADYVAYIIECAEYKAKQAI